MKMLDYSELFFHELWEKLQRRPIGLWGCKDFLTALGEIIYRCGAARNEYVRSLMLKRETLDLVVRILRGEAGYDALADDIDAYGRNHEKDGVFLVSNSAIRAWLHRIQTVEECGQSAAQELEASFRPTRKNEPTQPSSTTSAAAGPELLVPLAVEPGPTEIRVVSSTGTDNNGGEDGSSKKVRASRRGAKGEPAEGSQEDREVVPTVQPERAAEKEPMGTLADLARVISDQAADLEEDPTQSRGRQGVRRRRDSEREDSQEAEFGKPPERRLPAGKPKRKKRY